MGWKTRLVFVFVLLAGCATTANYERILASWVSKPVDNLIAAWGPPDQTYNGRDGLQYLTYLRSETAYVPGYQGPSTATTTVYGNTAYTTINPGYSSPGYNINYWCKTTFTVNTAGVIIAWRWQGNACKARAPD